jgi:hypothetical protein
MVPQWLVTLRLATARSIYLLFVDLSNYVVLGVSHILIIVARPVSDVVDFFSIYLIFQPHVGLT